MAFSALSLKSGVESLLAIVTARTSWELLKRQEMFGVLCGKIAAQDTEHLAQGNY